MTIQRGLYDLGSSITISEENKWDIEFEKRIYVDGWKTILISFEDIDLYSHDELNYSKYYYHPNKDIRYDAFKSTKWLRAFDLPVFFSPNYLVSNSISFKINGKWISFSTNAEYILQPIIDGHHTHVRLFMKKDPDLFYKWIEGRVEYKKINKVFLPKPSIISCELLDYYLFKGYDFYETNTFFDIQKGKDDIRVALKGLEYYFVGTSIYDNARDIDIYIHKKDFKEAVRRLEKSGFEKLSWRPSYGGTMFKDKYTSAKIDVIESPYSNYIEPIDKEHNADPLLMYFIQVNYFASICYDNLSEFFKIWRFNKLLETGKKLDILDGVSSHRFVNSYIRETRFQKYYDVFSHPEAIQDLYKPDNPVIKFNTVKIKNKYYTVVKSKHRTQLIHFNLPYTIKNLNIIDAEGVGKVVTIQESSNTKFQLMFLDDYILFSYERDE